MTESAIILVVSDLPWRWIVRTRGVRFTLSAGLTALLVAACAHRSGQPSVQIKMTAFMAPTATGAEIAAVRGTLMRDPHVHNVVFASQQDAYNEFKRLFDNSSTFVHSVNLADLPPTFRLNDDSSGDAVRLAADLRHAVGVRQVILPPFLPLVP